MSNGIAGRWSKCAVKSRDVREGVAKGIRVEEVGEKVDAAGDSLRLVAHGGVFKGEVDLGVNASKVGVDFLESLFAALEICETLLQDLQGGGFGVPNGVRNTRGGKIRLELFEFAGDVDLRGLDVERAEVLAGDEEFEVHPGELAEGFAVGVVGHVGVGTAGHVVDLLAALFEGGELFAVGFGKLRDQVHAFGFGVLGLLSIAKRVRDSLEARVGGKKEEVREFESSGNKPDDGVEEAEDGGGKDTEGVEGNAPKKGEGDACPECGFEVTEHKSGVLLF